MSSGGYQKLFEAIKSLGEPTRLMMDSLIAMANGRDHDGGEERESMVRNVEPIAHLVDWLPEINDHELQFETASAINQICSSSLQRLPFSRKAITYSLTTCDFRNYSKAMCCQRGLLRHVISVLEFHAKLNIRSIKQMLRLIQSLGSHSITAAELKLILRLMRDTNDEEVLYEIGFCHGSFNVIEKKKLCDFQFPYSSYVLHCLSSMAKKDAACQECHYYFDIQYETGNFEKTNF